MIIKVIFHHKVVVAKRNAIATAGRRAILTMKEAGGWSSINSAIGGLTV